MEQNTRQLDILDPETNITYSIFISKEDYIKAENDDYFVSALLKNAIKNNEMQVCDETETSAETQPDNTIASSNIAGTSNATTSIGACASSSNRVSGAHIWQYSETLALVKSMQVHMDDLNHPKKRKYVFDNCVNDLLSEGYCVTATQCQVKWKSLVRSYHSAKDNQTKTGRGPSRFQFFDEMDSILGTKPSNQCEHAIESDVNPGEKDNPTENVNTQSCEQNISAEEAPTVKEKTVNAKKRKIPEHVKYSVEQKNKRHAERMEIEKQKIQNDKEKIALLKLYLERDK